MMMARADIDMHTGHPNSYLSLRWRNRGTRHHKPKQSHKKRFHRKDPPQFDMIKTAPPREGSNAVQQPYLSLGNSDNGPAMCPR
jgi:hypothetical protein